MVAHPPPQRLWGSSFVPLEPGKIINYDISLEPNTLNLLEKEGVQFISFSSGRTFGRRRQSAMSYNEIMAQLTLDLAAAYYDYDSRSLI
jgi:arginine deiminase